MTGDRVVGPAQLGEAGSEAEARDPLQGRIADLARDAKRLGELGLGLLGEAGAARRATAGQQHQRP
jgi:hypothetical protein